MDTFFHKHPQKLHTRSFSSSTLWSSSSSVSSKTIEIPSSPLVPFAWEQHPGIPKDTYDSHSKINDPWKVALPLPPVRKPPVEYRRYARDPFASALLKCSKDHNAYEVVDGYWKSNKCISMKTLSDKFRVVDFNTSCKRTSDVVDSKVLIPKRRPRRNESAKLINYG